MKTLLVANTDWYLFNFRLSLANELKRQGFDVVFVSPFGEYVSPLEKLGFRWHLWALGRKSLSPWREAQAIRELAHIYRVEKPDFVHHFTMKPVLYGTWAAHWVGVKRIINCVTGLGYIWSSREFKARLLRPWLKLLFRIGMDADHVQVIFEHQGDLDFFLKEGLAKAHRCHLIQGVGVDVEKFHPYPEPDGEPVIVLPARMLWDKGVGVMVEAARLLRRRFKVRVVLVGKPDPGNPTSIDETILHHWEQQGIVEYWGWQEEMHSVYARSHIVALPSFHEGIPTVLLEAAASGRPIVATDIPGCRAVVQDGVNGFLVPVDNPQALAEALEKLVNDAHLRQKMGSAGRKLILDRFTVQSVNERTLNIYHSFQ